MLWSNVKPKNASCKANNSPFTFFFFEKEQNHKWIRNPAVSSSIHPVPRGGHADEMPLENPTTDFASCLLSSIQLFRNIHLLPSRQGKYPLFWR
jgi:hypothetical protein